MTDFPMDILIFNKIVEVFNQTRRYILLLFPLAFFIRIAFGFILLKTDSFVDILKDSLFLFLGLFFFTDILKLTLQIPYFVSSELSVGEWKNINLTEGIFTKALKRFVDWIGVISYWISFGLYVVIISILGFLAGYILFIGTMFRAYGLLKVFFILLFVVSLWPLLWHSINFAVYTIAVSDNAMANNVIIGGASLAKIFIPLWLLSKTSKIPVAQTLKKASFSGGSLAYAGGGLAYTGGSKAYSFIKNKIDNSNNQNIQEEEIESGGAEISFSQTDKGFQKDENYTEPEDFSINETENNPKAENEHHNEENLSVEQENHQEVLETINQENSITQESNISKENNIEITKDFNKEDSPQVTREQTISVSVEKTFNESTLENPKSEDLSQEQTIKEHDKKIFNEAIHDLDFEEGENYIAPRRHQKNDRGNEL